MSTSPLADSIGSLTLGEPVTAHNLTMFPLISAAEGASSYSTLDDAIGEGSVRITEVSDSGRVPELRFVNNGAKPVLVVDGEELVGAKQNRVVNLTILVAAQTSLTIPVACVESGRWRHRSAAFSATGRTQYATGRAARMSQVTRNLVQTGSRLCDQAAVWADISFKMQRMDTSSPTSAMSEMFERHSNAVDRYVAAFSQMDRQVGAVFAIDGGGQGLELFDCADTFRKLMPKLVRSWALDALEKPEEPAGRPDRDAAERFLSRVAQTDGRMFDAIATGQDLRLNAGDLTGAALLVDGQVIHMSAFQVPTGNAASGGDGVA